MRGVWDFMILTDKANLASNRLAYRCTRLYVHYFFSVTFKSLTISSRARVDTTTGEIVNLISVDAQQIAASMTYLNFLWSVQRTAGSDTVIATHNALRHFLVL